MPLDTFKSVIMPYCLKKEADGNYVVLNREYKPLGFITSEMIRYEQYPISAKLRAINEKKAQQLSHDASPNVERIFLYNGATDPTSNKTNLDAYLKRVEILLKLKVG